MSGACPSRVVEHKSLSHSPAVLPAVAGGSHNWLDCLASRATIVRVARNTEIIAQGESSEYCFQLVSGCVRTAMLLDDGRRQIGEFLFPGDVLGYDTADEQPYGASAVTEVVLRRFRRDLIEAEAARNPQFDQELRHYLTSQVRSARVRLALLGRGTAGERISSFLREMQARLSSAGSGGFEMPMKLTDVADYLGLALETVSRGMAERRRAGAVTASRSRITTRTIVGLKAGNGSSLHH